MQFTVMLTAGQRIAQQTAGGYFLILNTGAAPSLEVWLLQNSTELEYIRTAARGLKARMVPGVRFDRVELRATVDCTVEIIVSDGLVDVSTTDGATVTATIANTPLPVQIDGPDPLPVEVASTPAAPVFTRPAGGDVATVNNLASVPVTAAATALIAADPDRRELRFCNLGTNPVAIGAAGLTWAARAVVMAPGAVLIERTGAHLAWTGICDAALTTTVGLQTLDV